MKSGFRVLLVLLLTISTLCIAPAFAESSHPTGSFDLPGISIPSISELADSSSLFSLDKTAQLPSSYNLRDAGLVTSVKDQGEFGTCWAFATIAAIESNAVKKGYETVDTADFSELQLAYFQYNRDGVTATNALPELIGLSGDDIRLTGDESYLEIGGNPILASLHLATGIGVVHEKEVPYSLADVNLTLSPDLAVSKNLYTVVNSSFVSVADRDLVKQMLMENGCGVLQYYDSDIYYNESAVYQGEPSTAYYQKIFTSTNHAVTLVGWDDAYPKENFWKAPEGDGAWLAKNSWSTYWGDEGYFWISYEDTSLKFATFFEVCPAAEIDTLYQYDGTSNTAYIPASTSANGKYLAAVVNNFTAQGTETITAVSFMTMNPMVHYTVMAGPEKEDEAVSTEEGIAVSPGYHTIPLTTPFTVTEGEVFQVGVLFETDDTTVNIYERNELAVPFDKTSSLDWIEMDSSFTKGQGAVVLSHGSRDGAEYLDGGNFRIKAMGQEAVPELCYPYVPTDIPEGSVLVNVSNPSMMISVGKDGRIASDAFGEYRLSGGTGSLYTLIQPDAAIVMTDSLGNAVADGAGVLKSSGLTFAVQPVLSQYQPEALLFTMPTGAQYTEPLMKNVATIECLETGMLSGIWLVQALYNESVLDGMPREYLAGKTVVSFTAVPVVSAEPVIYEVFDLMDADTPGVVSMDVAVEAAGSLVAPSILFDGVSILVNESVSAVAWKDGMQSSLPVSLNADNSLNLSEADTVAADMLSVTFIGRPLGDVTGDGKADTLDAARILQASTNLYQFDEKGLMYGDVSDDGLVNTFDAARILQYSAKLTDEYYNLVSV